MGMSAINPPKPPKIDAYHRERSKCLDAFITCEEVVISLLVKAEVKFGGEPFGKKIEKLRKAKVGKLYSEQMKSQTDILLVGFEELMKVRNDLVHARLRLECIDGVEKACFINARECTNGTQVARLFSLESLRAVTRKASELANELREPVPPSPPLQTPPDAAAAT
jgi:hypothetical protein